MCKISVVTINFCTMNKKVVVMAFSKGNQNSALKLYLISITKMRGRLGNSKWGWVVIGDDLFLIAIYCSGCYLI